MSNNDSGIQSKNCKVKRSIIDEDIEMLEEDDEEEIVEVPTLEQQQPPPKPENQVVKDHIVYDISGDDDHDNVIPPVANPIDMANKMQRIKHIKTDVDIEMVEEADSDIEDVVPAETPCELLQANPAAAQQNDNEDNRVSMNDSNTVRDGSGNSTQNDGNDSSAAPSSSPPSNNSFYSFRTRNQTPQSQNADTRKVQPEDYEFGVSSKNNENKRLIVREENDKTLCREYAINHGSSWYCRLCCSKTKQRFYSYFDENKIFNALVHHVCDPITYEQSQIDQANIKQQYAKLKNQTLLGPDYSNGSNRKRKSRATSVFHNGYDNNGDDNDYVGDEPLPTSTPRAARSRTMHYREIDHLENDLNHVGKSQRLSERISGGRRSKLGPLAPPVEPSESPAEAESVGNGNSNERLQSDDEPREESESPAEQASQDINPSNNYSALDDFDEPPTPPSRLNSTTPHPGFASPAHTPSPPGIVESDSEAILPLPVRFDHPSSSFLFGCCEKLKIPSSLDAYAFWARIQVDFINPNSVPQTSCTIFNEKMPGFASISLLLTGGEFNASDIKNSVTRYLLENSKAIGELVGEDISLASHPMNVDTVCAKDLTEMHFVTMAQWFQCRFMVFEDGNWKRYGDWKNATPYLQLFLMENRNGHYYPILSF